MNHQTAVIVILYCATRRGRKTAEWAKGKCTIILSKGSELSVYSAFLVNMQKGCSAEMLPEMLISLPRRYDEGFLGVVVVCCVFFFF